MKSVENVILYTLVILLTLSSIAIISRQLGTSTQSMQKTEVALEQEDKFITEELYRYTECISTGADVLDALLRYDGKYRIWIGTGELNANKIANYRDMFSNDYVNTANTYVGMFVYVGEKTAAEGAKEKGVIGIRFSPVEEHGIVIGAEFSGLPHADSFNITIHNLNELSRLHKSLEVKFATARSNFNFITSYEELYRTYSNMYYLFNGIVKPNADSVDKNKAIETDLQNTYSFFTEILGGTINSPKYIEVGNLMSYETDGGSTIRNYRRVGCARYGANYAPFGIETSDERLKYYWTGSDNGTISSVKGDDYWAYYWHENNNYLACEKMNWPKFKETSVYPYQTYEGSAEKINKYLQLTYLDLALVKISRAADYLKDVTPAPSTRPISTPGAGITVAPGGSGYYANFSTQAKDKDALQNARKALTGYKTLEAEQSNSDYEWDNARNYLRLYYEEYVKYMYEYKILSESVPLPSPFADVADPRSYAACTDDKLVSTFFSNKGTIIERQRAMKELLNNSKYAEDTFANKQNGYNSTAYAVIARAFNITKLTEGKYASDSNNTDSFEAIVNDIDDKLRLLPP